MKLGFENNRITIQFIAEKGIDVTTYTVKTYAKAFNHNTHKILIYTSEEIDIKPDANSYFLDIDYWFYTRVAKYIGGSSKSLPSCIDFSFSICIGEEENEIPNIYKIHFIRYLPELVTKTTFFKAESPYKKWFVGQAEDDATAVAPEIDFVDFEELLSFSDLFKKQYSDLVQNVIKRLEGFGHSEIKEGLRTSIKKMILDKEVMEPSTMDDVYAFGNIAYDVVDTDNGLEPNYHVYNFHSAPIEESYKVALLQETKGLLSRTPVMHVIAIGKLTYFQGKTKVNVKQLGFYVKDRYSFNEVNEPVPSLAMCRIDSKEEVFFDSSSVENTGYFEINNNNFVAYRKDHDRGGDFNWYSSIHLVEVSIDLIV